MWRGPCHNGHRLGTDGCEDCRIGCFKPARFRNPNYDPEGKMSFGVYNYAEWLCAQHYDEVMSDKSEEEIYGDDNPLEG